MHRLIMFYMLSFLILTSLQAKAAQDGEIAALTRMGVVKKTGLKVDKLIYYSDGLQVKAIIFIPPSAVRGGGKSPLIIYNHDGVDGLSDKTWRFCKDMAVSSGYIIAAPTYRGEDGSQGEIEVAGGEVNDVLSLIKALSCYEIVDTGRIALFGTSHGALVSVMAAARDKKNCIKCIVEAYGVMDILSWWDYLTRDGHSVNDSLSKKIYGDGPKDRPEAFEHRMAVNKVSLINCPVLIVQGEEDDIVPVGQAYLFSQALAMAGKSYELKIYPNAGHGFLIYAPYAENNSVYSKEEQKEAREGLLYIVDFIRKYL